MKSKKIFRRILSFVALSIFFAGMYIDRGNDEKKMEDLMGSWIMSYEANEDLARDCLENIDFAEEEIALVDLNSMKMCVYVEYGKGTYRIAVDPVKQKEYVREYFVGAFDALYEGRLELNELYGETFDALSKGEFQQYYAELYGMDTFTDLIDHFSENVFDYEQLAADAETGTFRIRGDRIYRTIDGETEEEYMGYQIQGNTLTLIYEDFEEVFTRVQ